MNFIWKYLKDVFALTASRVAGIITPIFEGVLIIKQPTTSSVGLRIRRTNDVDLITISAASGAVTSGYNYVNDASGDTVLVAGRNSGVSPSTLGLCLGSAAVVNWASGTSAAFTSPDVGLERLAAGVVGSTDAGTGTGWLCNEAGVSRVATDVTVGDVTPAVITGLSATLKAGRTYTGRLVLKVSNDTAVDGLRIDFDGGDATMTNFDAGVVGAGVPAATFSVSVSAALATDLIATALADTNPTFIEIAFGFTVNAAGTFIPRIALEADSGGTITVHDNSYMWIEDTP